MAFPDGMSGTDRMQRLVQVQRIRSEAHLLALQATEDVRSHLPGEYHDWAYDLRRDRVWAFGGLTRFIDMLSHGHLSRVKARELAHRLLELARAYVDLVLPAIQESEAKPEAERVRVYRPAVPMQGLRVVRSGSPGEGRTGRGVA